MTVLLETRCGCRRFLQVSNAGKRVVIPLPRWHPVWTSEDKEPSRDRVLFDIRVFEFVAMGRDGIRQYVEADPQQ